MTVSRTHPPTRAMRETPDIDQLKRQAKELLEAYRAQSPDAIIEVGAHHHTATPETFALHDAQLVLARSYGFPSWPKMKAYMDSITVGRLVDAIRAGDLKTVRSMVRVGRSSSNWMSRSTTSTGLFTMQSCNGNLTLCDF